MDRFSGFMHLLIETRVERDFAYVQNHFDQRLFTALNPPFPPVRLRRYDGNQPGDEVHIELNFFLFRQQWISRITENRSDSQSYVFVDEGVRLPFFLRAWRHVHRIEKEGAGARIVDDITFRIPWLLVPFVYPALYFQFKYRQPIYRRFFKR